MQGLVCFWHIASFGGFPLSAVPDFRLPPNGEPCRNTVSPSELPSTSARIERYALKALVETRCQ
jgi:hypothetical protein